MRNAPPSLWMPSFASRITSLLEAFNFACNPETGTMGVYSWVGSVVSPQISQNQNLLLSPSDLS